MEQDNSDAQYRSFRNNIPVLAIVAALFLGVKALYTRNLSLSARSSQERLHLIPFELLFSLLFLCGLHGASIVKILAILTCNYVIASTCGGASRIGPITTWLFNGAVLFANDRYNGFLFGDILPVLSFLVSW
jgi:protein-cysteine N-palmitoyltransferase HHAT